jgi:hypothetical protein
VSLRRIVMGLFGMRSRRTIGGLAGFLVLFLSALITVASPQAINGGNRLPIPAPTPTPTPMPSIVQGGSSNCFASSPYALQSAPTNGHTLVLLTSYGFNLTGAVVTDSNSASYALRAEVGTGPSGAIYDGAISGSPSATIGLKISGTTVNTSTCLMELSGVNNSLTQTQSYYSANSGTSASVTFPTGNAGDIIAYTTSSTNSFSMATNNGATFNDLSNPSIGYAIATAAGSTTLTMQTLPGSTVTIVATKYTSVSSATPVPNNVVYAPVSPAATSSPYPGGGQYYVPTPTAGLSTPGSGTAIIGAVVGDACMAMANVGNSTTASQTITLRSNQELCVVGMPGDVNTFTWSPADTGIVNINPSYTKLNVAGIITGPFPNSSGESVMYRMPRTAGQTYVMTATNTGVTETYTFNVATLSDAAEEANEAQPVRPVTNFGGAFARPNGGGGPPFSMFSGGTTTAPSPYPSPQPTNLFGSTGYCDHVATNGYALSTGFPLNYVKMLDLVQLGVQWTRTTEGPFFDDSTHNGGGYHWGDLDALICGEIRNNILPTIDLQAGPVEYSGTQNALYKSPADFGTFAGALAAHLNAAFPTVMRWTIPINEPNTLNSGTTYPDWVCTLATNPTTCNGPAGIAAYMKAGYQAIKAVNSNYIVYGPQLNMDQSALPVGFMQSLMGAGCRVGVCYDGIDLHAAPNVNDPHANYDASDPGYQQGDGTSSASIDALDRALHTFGEVGFIHYLVGETGIFPTTISSNSMIGTLGGAAYQWSNWLNYLEQPHPYFIDGAMVANVDEDCEFVGGVFANGGLMAPPNPACSPSPGPSTTFSPRPAYAVVQAFNGVNPASPPTVAPSTLPNQPTPPANPTYVQSECAPFGQITLGTAPTNGHMVTAFDDFAFNLSGNSFTDSNSVSYTQQLVNGSGESASIWDKIVAGSPTASGYTFANAGNGCIIETANVSAGIYAGNNTTSSGTTLTYTSASVAQGAVVYLSGYSSTAFTMAATNVTGLTLLSTSPGSGNSGAMAIYKGTATAAGTISVTETTTAASTAISQLAAYH